MIDLEKEMAWITFLDDGWRTKWHPITDISGRQLEFNDATMDYCRKQYNNRENWVYFGVSPTSQMILKHSVTDNL